MKQLEQMTQIETYEMGIEILQEFKKQPELYVACPDGALEEIANNLGYPLSIIQFYFFATVQGYCQGYMDKTDSEWD